MRGLTMLIATILTFGYFFAAQAAMTVDRAETFRRVAPTVDPASPADAANRVWYAGTLTPVVVEAPPPDKCTI